MTKEIFPVSTPKGIFLELIKPDGQPERQLCQYEALHMCLTDPINILSSRQRQARHREQGPLGHDHQLPEDAPGPTPSTHRS